MAVTTFDYIIAGGGTAGCVIASRLSHLYPEYKVAIIEAGADARDHELILDPKGVVKLHGSELEWNYETTPQKSLDGKKVYYCTGKLLSGSSGVNYGMWVRGHKKDYDHLSETVGDGKWSYEHMLPCFKRTETHFAEQEQEDQLHGSNGPIHTTTQSEFPLSKTLARAFEQTGIPFNKDTNSGDPIGYGLVTDSWYKDRRQLSGKAYDLSKVTIFVDSPLAKIILEPTAEGPIARGVEVIGGKSFRANKEVILCAGAIRTPQVLMLSGLGPAAQLKAIGVEPVVDIPEVGQNFHDHAATMLQFILKHPERGLAAGSAKFPFSISLPRDFVYTDTISKEKLAAALARDYPGSDVSKHRNITDPSSHFEMVVSYNPVGGNFMRQPPPNDGSIMTIGCGLFQPTSRGTISLTSSDPGAVPIIDPHFLSTEHDLCIMRETVRQAIRILESEAGAEEIDGVWAIPGEEPLSLATSDEELNDYFRKSMITWFHPAGTAAMGKVVDSSCRVNGVAGLRVVDASILPDPLSAHYQSPIYAIAERVVELIRDNE